MRPSGTGPGEATGRRARIAALACAVATAGACGCSRKTSGTIPDVESTAEPEWGKRTAPHWTSFETSTLRWARRHEAHDLFAAMGSDGSAAIAADFAGTTSLGGAPVTSAGATDVVLVVSAADGSPRWTKSFGNARLQYPTGVAVTPGGAVVLGVESQGALDFGAGPVDPGAGGHVVVRFTAGGALAWATTLAQAYDPAVVATDDESVLVTDGDRRVARWSDAGAPIWSRRFEIERARRPSWTDPRSFAVAASSDRTVFAAGAFETSLAPGDGLPPLSSSGGDDAFVVALDERGRARWARRFGGAGDQAIHAAAALPGGGVVVAGDWDGGFDASTDAGAGKAPSAASGHGCFVVAFDEKGARVWSRTFAGLDGAATIRGLAVDGAGRIAIAGDFEGVLDVGQSLRALGSRDAFLVRLARDGTFVSARRFGDDWPQRGASVSADRAGTALVVGAQPVGRAGDTSDSDWFVISVP